MPPGPLCKCPCCIPVVHADQRAVVVQGLSASVLEVTEEVVQSFIGPQILSSVAQPVLGMEYSCRQRSPPGNRQALQACDSRAGGNIILFMSPHRFDRTMPTGEHIRRTSNTTTPAAATYCCVAAGRAPRGAPARHGRRRRRRAGRARLRPARRRHARPAGQDDGRDGARRRDHRAHRGRRRLRRAGAARAGCPRARRS